MISDLVRDADPTACVSDADLDTSWTSERMLATILDTPRSQAHKTRRYRPPTRLRTAAVGVTLAGAAAAGAFALTLTGGHDSWPTPAHKAPTVSQAGFTVHRRADGSVAVTIRLAQLRDPTALQRTLRADGVKAVVLTKRYVVRLNHPPFTGPPTCSLYKSYLGGLGDGHKSGGPPATDARLPVYYSESSKIKDLVIHLRPDRLPANGTFLIEIRYAQGSEPGVIAADVALGQLPTCVGL